MTSPDAPNPSFDQRLDAAMAAFLAASTWDACRQAVREHQTLLLSDAADIYLEALIVANTSDEQTTRILQLLRDLLRRCRAEGIDAAFASLRTPDDEQDDPLETAVLAFVTARSWDESKQVVIERQTLLLSDAAEAYIEQLIEDYEQDAGTVRVLEHRRELLRRSRAEGIDAAYADPDSPSDIQNNPALQAILAEIDRPARQGDMPRRIELCRAALAMVDSDDQDRLWASLQNELGKSFAQNPVGDKANNQEQAIVAYEAALRVRTEVTLPQDWAATQNNLGNVYTERICGDKAKNQEQAIAYFNAALRVYTEAAFPEDWAMTQNNLGVVYSKRIRGNKADNQELAIALYEAALHVHTEDTFPEDWARTQNNLGIVYQERIRGDKADNQEQALASFKAALRVYTEAAHPEDWARIQNNRGNVYRERIRGDKADNQEQALVAYRAALRVHTEDTFPERWARIQNNRGNVYRERIRGDKAKNQKQAIAYFNAALRVRTEAAFPEDWAMTQNNLGTVYQERVRGDKADNQEQALTYFKAALRVRTEAAIPQDWAMTQNNLGIAYSERICGDRADNHEQSIVAYRAALRVYTPTLFPQRSVVVAYHLGALLYAEGQLEAARQALTQAHEAVDVLRGFVSRDQARRDLSNEYAVLYALLVACCLRLGDIAAAFTFATAGKGRAFIDLLNTARFDLAAMGADDPALAVELGKARAVREQIDALLARLERDPTSGQKLLEQLERLQYEETTLWKELAFQYPALTATQQAPQLSIADAHALSQSLGATLVEYVEHALGWTAFVVTPDALHAVALPGVTDELAHQFEQWYAVIALPYTPDVTSYRPLIALHDAALAPLQPYVPPNTPLVLAPAGWLHRVPFAAALNSATGAYACHEYNLSFAPSLGALHVSLAQARRQASTQSRRTALTVAYPGIPRTSGYLKNVVAEAKVVSAKFQDVTALHHEQARPDAVIAHAPHKTIIHFGCHALFDARNPQQSGLALAGGWLTVQRIITELRLTDAELVTLGACETGLSHVEGGEEHVGLVQAMLSTGARTVVGSLWSVEDESTRTLFERFYTALAARVPPAAALRVAQHQVARHPDHPEWEHPMFWAAFQVYGLGDALSHRTTTGVPLR